VEVGTALKLPNPESALWDEAFVLMERALELLDRVGLQEAAIHLDHAICLVPDSEGKVPRTARLTHPPSL
jgi:hypothetical protein